MADPTRPVSPPEPLTLAYLIANRQVPDTATPKVTLGEIRATLDAARAQDETGLRARIDGLTKFEMADWPGQDFLLYEDVVALASPTPTPADPEP